MAWYLDTSAFLKLIVAERESDAMRTWFASHGPSWSSHLLQTEAFRAAMRLGIDDRVVEACLDAVSLVAPSPATFSAAGRMRPPGLRSLDALHLATALELGDDLEGVVTYDLRLGSAAEALAIDVVTPG